MNDEIINNVSKELTAIPLVDNAVIERLNNFTDGVSAKTIQELIDLRDKINKIISHFQIKNTDVKTIITDYVDHATNVIDYKNTIKAALEDLEKKIGVV